MTALFIGIMSGTSLDGIDAVLAQIDTQGHTQVIGMVSREFSKPLKKTLLELQDVHPNELHHEALAGSALAVEYADAVKDLLTQENVSTKDIVAIGAHGQTIRHQPNLQNHLAYSWQTLNPALLAELSEINVCADFRNADIAAGGQGAPLVPAFHFAQFADIAPATIINIGGISNITVIPSRTLNEVIGFDCGPGNLLMDAWIMQEKQEAYDHDGQWAQCGQVHQALLESFLSEPYFLIPAPKSTGRDLFNHTWLSRHLEKWADIEAKDVQRTLLELTTVSITQAIRRYANTGRVILCGGGAKNGFLVERIQTHLPDHLVSTSTLLGIDAQAVEGAAFAWLAWACINKKPANLPAVTGARRPKVLGALYYA
jgi:anhydro-N-acetylmuramic acid kinase